MSSQDPITNADFCPVCRTLPLSELTFGMEGPRMEYHINNSSLINDLENDDKFNKCALYYLARSMQRIWAGEEEYPTEASYTELAALEFTCGRDSESKVKVTTDQNTLISKLQAPKRWLPVHSDPQHPFVTERLRGWMRNCDSKHEGCRVEEIPVLPTRVLDLEGGPSSSTIKLLETESDQRGQYIALSHCWGTSHPFITTKNNIESMKNSIQLSETPATFQDAVTVSRQLGIRYLWIDSLCIIQGDAHDWELESSRMGTIYRSATLVLSASNASADSDGFLKPRPFTHTPLVLISSSSPTQSTEVYLVAQKGEPPDFWSYMDIQQKQPQPLDTRGWCLQETYLANRQLKFLHNRILWACQDAQMDEVETDGTFSMPGTGAVFITQNLYRNSVPRRHRTFNLMTPYQGWYRMVADYSKRSLTFVQDKMTALSGLAGVVASHDEGKYCAGVWWEDVAFGICWKRKVDGVPGRLERTAVYVAPSWSWASVNGAVEFIDAHENYQTQTKVSLVAGVIFDGFQVKNSGFDVFGRIEIAWIKVKAPMAALERVDDGTFGIAGVESSEKVELSFDIEDEAVEDLSVLFLLRRLDNSMETAMIHGGYEKGVLGVILFGLIIRAVPHSWKEPQGLEVEDKSRVYERIGMLRILTLESRESEFWGKDATSIVLV